MGERGEGGESCWPVIPRQPFRGSQSVCDVVSSRALASLMCCLTLVVRAHAATVCNTRGRTPPVCCPSFPQFCPHSFLNLPSCPVIPTTHPFPLPFPLPSSLRIPQPGEHLGNRLGDRGSDHTVWRGRRQCSHGGDDGEREEMGERRERGVREEEWGCIRIRL